MTLASGVPFTVQRSIDTLECHRHRDRAVDAVARRRWVKGRYPELVAWLQRMHARGAVLCSACSGVFLLAETGCSTAATPRCTSSTSAVRAGVPQVPIHPDRVLVISGAREELVSSGASTTWHDMVLYLIARFAGATDAQAVARLYALQWHQDGLAPYITFEGKRDHGDAEIEAAQRWLAAHFSVANPVDEMIKRSELAERTFKRRFNVGHRPAADRLRAAPAHRGRQAAAGAHRRIRWTTSVGASATRTPRSFAGCSSAPPAWRRAHIASDFASRSSRGVAFAHDRVVALAGQCQPMQQRFLHCVRAWVRAGLALAALTGCATPPADTPVIAPPTASPDTALPSTAPAAAPAQPARRRRRWRKPPRRRRRPSCRWSSASSPGSAPFAPWRWRKASAKPRCSPRSTACSTCRRWSTSIAHNPSSRARSGSTSTTWCHRSA
jgi:hypothetical protein